MLLENDSVGGNMTLAHKLPSSITRIGLFIFKEHGLGGLHRQRLGKLSVAHSIASPACSGTQILSPAWRARSEPQSVSTETVSGLVRGEIGEAVLGSALTD